MPNHGNLQKYDVLFISKLKELSLLFKKMVMCSVCYNMTDHEKSVRSEFLKQYAKFISFQSWGVMLNWPWLFQLVFCDFLSQESQHRW